MNELIVAIGRSQDPYKLNEQLIPHLEALIQIPVPTEKPLGKGVITFTFTLIHFLFHLSLSLSLGDIESDTIYTCSWEACAKGLQELMICLQIFIDFTQVCKQYCTLTLPV